MVYLFDLWGLDAEVEYILGLIILLLVEAQDQNMMFSFPVVHVNPGAMLAFRIFSFLFYFIQGMYECCHVFQKRKRKRKRKLKQDLSSVYFASDLLLQTSFCS